MKPNQKLADALESLKEIQDNNVIAIYTENFKTVKHRQLLLKYGFIREVSKGWYIKATITLLHFHMQQPCLI